jgi:hypothetical protein
MFALCPKCSNAVEDTGQGQYIQCPECGTRIRSRYFSDLRLERDEEKPRDHVEMRQPPPYQYYQHPPPPYYPPQMERGRPKALKKGYDLFSNAVSLISVLFVIVICLLLISNFVFLFAAIPMVYRGTTTDLEFSNEGHQLEIVVDDTPPTLTAGIRHVENTTLLEIDLTLEEEHIGEVVLECGGEEWDLTPPLGSSGTVGIQRVFKPGRGITEANVTAVDMAGNSARTSVTFPPALEPSDYIIPVDTHPYVSDNILLEFVSKNAYENAYVVFEFGVENIQKYLDPGINNVSIPAGVYGNFTLNTVVELGSGEVVGSSYRLEAPTVEEKRSGRVTNFDVGSRLDLPDYMDGLYIGTNPMWSSFDSHIRLRTAEVHLGGREMRFSGMGGGDRYRMDLLAPEESGSYEAKLEVRDMFGDVYVKTRTIDVAEEDYPILFCYQDNGRLYSFPAFVNSGKPLLAGFYYQDGIEQHRSSLNGEGGAVEGDLPDQGSSLKTYSYDLTNAPEGDYLLSLEAQSSSQAKNAFVLLLPFPPFLFVFNFHLTGIGFFLYFLFLVGMITGSLALLLFKDLVPSVKKLFKPDMVRVGRNFRLPRMPSLGSRNTFILIIQLLSATIFASVTVALFTMMISRDFGQPTSLSGGTPPWRILYALANASVWEEIISRFLLIGIPLAIYEVISRLLFKEKVNKFLNCFFGGNLKIEPKDILLILFSATLFGLGHFSGWSAWKVIPTFLGGLAFGYLFYKKGLHAAILLHFATDYLTIGLYIPNNPLALLVALMMAMAAFTMAAFGFFYSIQYTREMFAKVFRIRQRPSETMILSSIFIALVLDILVILFFAYLGSTEPDPARSTLFYFLAIFLVFGLSLMAVGCFFALIRMKWVALSLLLAGAFFSLPVTFVSVLACVAAYDLYLKIRKDQTPVWVLRTYKKPRVPLSPSKRTP